MTLLLLCYQADAEAFVALAKEVNATSATKQELDENLLTSFAMCAMQENAAMQPGIGGNRMLFSLAQPIGQFHFAAERNQLILKFC